MQATATARRVTVSELAAAKGLPEDWLRQLGVRDLERGGVAIPYRGFDGKTVLATRLRTALRARDGSYWAKGTRLTEAYGLWRLNPYHGGGDVFLVEGETSAWTLWHHGYQALGLPGASLAKQTLHKDALQNVSRLWVLQDPGRGGEEFYRGVVSALAFCRFNGAAFVTGCGAHKDVSELHLAVGGDRLAFECALSGLRRGADPVPQWLWLTPAAVRSLLTEALRDPTPWLRRLLLDLLAEDLGALVAGLVKQGGVARG